MITIEKDGAANAEFIQRSTARTIPGADKILRDVVHRSVEVWRGLDDGRVGAIWGLIPPTILSETAWLWMLYDPELVEKNKFFLVRNSQRFIEHALELYPTITGHVDQTSKMSMKWLKWLGAEFGRCEKGYLSFTIRRR